MENERLINAEALKKCFPNLGKGYEHQIKDGYFSPQYVETMINEAPTIEVARVTLCHDCVYLDMGANDADAWCRCRILRKEVDPYFFCGYARQKKGEKQ